ncbi:hypothetical protein [Priestia megaterium]|uniref:hypothetical protein n=1 Tax=Priestia megaterium TaxID=1404 RepID=UPI003008AA0F
MKYKDNPEKLLGAEKYMEMEGYDIRLAVQKMNDFLDTLGDATIALIYSNKDEYKNNNSREALFVRRIHIRHAIIDFNNCFDLLLQIPWFYYRAWQEFNPNGNFYNNKISEVIRNTDGWIEIAEKNCSYNRLKKFLGMKTEQNVLNFKKELIKFCNSHIYNENDPIVVRSIANKIKHNHSLKIKDLYEPYNLAIKVNGVKIYLKDLELGAKYGAEFYDEKTKKILGDIQINYFDDMEVSITYKGGEIFRGKDILREDSWYYLEDLYSKLVTYRDEIIDLYMDFYNLIKKNIEINPMFANDTIRKGPEIKLDKFFKGPDEEVN